MLSRGPHLPRGVRLKRDEARGRWTLLAPERIFEIDDTAATVLELCDGERDLAAIVAELAARYTAPPGGDREGRRRHARRPQGQESARDMTAHTPPPPAPPIGLLVELTHRCPLGCLYCSNPVALERPGNELDGETWKKVFSEAAALGALHVHLSGGEPTARRDIVDLTRHASQSGLYTNLITSGHRGEREADRRTGRRRPRPCAAVLPGRRQGDQRPPRPLQRLVGAQARLRCLCDQGGPAADHQRGHPSLEYSSGAPCSSILRSSLARAGSKWRIRNITAGRSPIAPR